MQILYLAGHHTILRVLLNKATEPQQAIIVPTKKKKMEPFIIMCIQLCL